MRRVGTGLLVLPILVALVSSVVFATGLGQGDLIAGGGNAKSAQDVGFVRAWQDDCGEWYIHYETMDEGGWCWCISEIHAHVATTLEGIPQKNGNPIPGQFDYKYEFDECVRMFDVPIGQLDPGTYYIAAHSVVKNECTCEEETAWGGCLAPDYSGQFPGKNWAMYFTLVVD